MRSYLSNGLQGVQVLGQVFHFVSFPRWFSFHHHPLGATFGPLVSPCQPPLRCSSSAMPWTGGVSRDWMSPFAFWNCLEDRISPFGIVLEYLRPSSAREKHLLIHLGWTLRDWAFTLGCPSELVLSRPSRQDVNPNGCGRWAGKVSLRWNFTVGSTNSFALAILLPHIFNSFACSLFPHVLSDEIFSAWLISCI